MAEVNALVKQQLEQCDPRGEKTGEREAAVESGLLDMAAFGMGDALAPAKPPPPADAASGLLDMAAFGMGDAMSLPPQPSPPPPSVSPPSVSALPRPSPRPLITLPHSTRRTTRALLSADSLAQLQHLLQTPPQEEEAPVYVWSNEVRQGCGCLEEPVLWMLNKHCMTRLIRI